MKGRGNGKGEGEGERGRREKKGREGRRPEQHYWTHAKDHKRSCQVTCQTHTSHPSLLFLFLSKSNQSISLSSISKHSPLLSGCCQSFSAHSCKISDLISTPVLLCCLLWLLPASLACNLVMNINILYKKYMIP